MTGASSIPILVAVIVVVRQKMLINRFIRSNAISASSAKTPDELNVSRRLIFNKFKRRNIIIEVNGKYYLDKENLEKYRAKKRMIVLPIVLLIVLLFILMDVFLT